MQSEQELNHEKNRIKLLLEASIYKKVQILNIKPINKLDKSKLSKDEISYDVWLYNLDLLKEVVPSVMRNIEYVFGKNQNTSACKFKLGTIIMDDLIPANRRLSEFLSSNNISFPPGSYYVILAHAYVGSAQTFLLEDDPREKEVKFFQQETANIYYIHGEPSEENKNIQTYHWFIIKDNTKLVLDYLVNFTVDSSDIKCYNPNCSNQNTGITDMRYCHNDQKYFCTVCVEEYHNKQTFNTLKKHNITQAMSYSITYTNNCSDHKLKVLEFYCYDCNSLYCTKCFEPGGKHDNLKNHNVRQISEVFSSFELEMSTLNSRIKDMLIFIDEEIEKRQTSVKEIQKIHKSALQEVNDKLAKVQEELENEILFRSTYLASISVEIQRLISEIDSKIYFLKHQFMNADMSTYISMSNMFNKYMKDELIPNLDMLCNLGFDQITQNLYNIEKKDTDINKN